MNRAIGISVLLLATPAAFAAPADAPSTSGLWKIEGEVMGTPVSMMCTLTEAAHKLSGTCSGAADGFAPHKVAGSVKAQKVEMYFQAAIGGNALTLIVNGTLNEDRSKMDGGLDVEPMAVTGTFTAVREPDYAGPPAEDAPPAAPATAPASSSAQTSATGAWKIDANVQATEVSLTCVLAETDRKLTGNCTAAEDDAPHALTGTSTDTSAGKGLDWHFDADFQGQPLHISMTATLAAGGTSMTGTVAVAPLDATGTFTGVRQ